MYGRKFGFGMFAAVALAGVFAFADGVTPGVGSVGSELTVDATASALGTKRPKVVLDDGNGKPLKLKVTAWDGSVGTAQVKKARTGTFDVVVQQKGFDEVRFDDAFQIVVGTIESVGPEAPAPKTEITIAGSNFGTKKGKVRVGGKAAKVKSWTDTQIVAQLHKKTPAGDQALLVTNKVGDAVFESGTINVGESGGSGTPTSSMSARFDRDVLRGNGDDIVVVPSGNGYVVTITADARRGGTATIVVDLSNLDLSAVGVQNGVEPAEVRLTSDGSTWSALSGSGSVSARVSVNATLVDVDFDGDLPRTSGSGTPDPMPVGNGALRFAR